MSEAIVRLGIDFEDLTLDDRSRICRTLAEMDCTGDETIELHKEQ